MKKRFLLRVVFFSLGLLFFSWKHHAQAAPLDFNKDKKSDFILVTINSDNTLTWKVYSTTGEFLEEVTAFGANGDHLVPAAWVKNIPLLASVQNNSGEVQWNVRRNAAQYETIALGSSQDTLLSGADYDGDGNADAAAVSTRGNSRYWRINFSPLAKKKVLRDRFGRSTDIPFFVNIDGKEDSMALMRGENTIVVRDAIRRKTTTIRLPRAFSTRPLPVRQKNKIDVMVFSETDGTQTNLFVVNIKGELTHQQPVAASGIMVVGDYLASSGEEIAIQTSEGMSIINPVTGATGSVIVPSGIPVDEININTFSSAPSACEDETKNPTDGANGFLFKPISDSTKKLAVHAPASLTGKIAYIEITEPAGSILERGVFGGIGNGGRYLARFSKPGGSYPDGSIVVIHLNAGCRISYPIPDTSRRWD